MGGILGRGIRERGAKAGSFSPCLFYQPELQVKAWVHGDDMTLEGRRAEARALEAKLKERMLIKRRAELGWTSADDKKISLLNRLIELKVENGERVLRFEPDPRHVQIALHDLGFNKKGAKPLSSPGANDVEFACQDELPEDERTKFRSITMRIAFLAQDLPHLMHPVKEAARKMQLPTLGAWRRLKRIGRYLLGRPRCVQRFMLQPEVEALTVKTDSDHAGCKETRLSTSCCLLPRGKHVLRCSSSTQKIQGLSSGESELMALVRGGSIGLGAQAMAAYFGQTFGLDMETDSSAAKGVAMRRGVGKIRHLHTPLLWLQRRVTNRELRIWKVKGTENEADVGTKPLAGDALDRILERLGFAFEQAPSEQALTAAVG